MPASEQRPSSIMDRIRKLVESEQPYEPIEDCEAERDDQIPAKRGFSYVDYSIFLLLGVSMLWAWNMFLAAGPYFQMRFRHTRWIFDNFQAAEISVSTLTNLSSMLVLTRMQAKASYPRRIIASLIINMAVFSLLAGSTAVETSAEVYFAFLMIMMVSTSLATGLCQNGIFAYVSGFAQPKYTQGIMTGQAIAGVLPCVVQIVSIVLVQGTPHQKPGDPHAGPGSGHPPQGPPPVRWTAALAYFLTAAAISVATLLAFLYLMAREWRSKQTRDITAPDSTEASEERKSVPMSYLFRKLRWPALGVFVTFAVTMFFPVFTQRILSVRPVDQQPPLLQPASFIPLAFLFWNAGDLVGRLLTAVPSLSLVLRPRIVFVLAVLRLAFIGLYYLCNIRGQGAIVSSDVFYLVVVQVLFGLSNGYLGSTCMIGIGEWVEPDELEAAGGFMGLCLVCGLTVGSLLSFLVART